MTKNNSHLSEALRTILPWITAGAAFLIAAVILSSFIDTLQLSIQRGDALREALAQQQTTRGMATTQMVDAGTYRQPVKD